MGLWPKIVAPSQYEQDLKKEIESTIGTGLGQNPDIIKLHQEYMRVRLARHAGTPVDPVGQRYGRALDFVAPHFSIIQPLPEPPPEAKSWREDYTGKLED